MPSDAEIRALIGRLENLHEIFLVQGKILALGRVAVDPLADFLLLTLPSACPDSRVAAVECLGAFGGERAVAALIRVLDDRERLDPVVSFAEERVRSAAARALGRLGDARAVAPLLRALERGRLVGAGEALAEMGEVLGVPGLIACLEEPRKEPAIEALLRFGKRAVPLLVAALRAPRLVEGSEPPTSAERRACCATILGRLREPEALAALVDALDDPIPEVRAEAALAVVAVALEPPAPAVWRLASALADVDLERQRRAEEALASLGERAIEPLLSAARGSFGDADADATVPTRARLAAVKLLGRLRSPRIAPALAGLLDDGDPRLRLAALRAAAVQGEEALGVLRRAQKDPLRAIRDEAGRALERFGGKERAGLLSRWIR